MSSEFGFTTPDETRRENEALRRKDAEQARGEQEESGREAAAENVMRDAVEEVIRSKLAAGHSKVEKILQDYKNATRSDAYIDVYYLGEEKPPDIQIVFDKPAPELNKLEEVLRAETGLRVSVAIRRKRETPHWYEDENDQSEDS